MVCALEIDFVLEMLGEYAKQPNLFILHLSKNPPLVFSMFSTIFLLLVVFILVLKVGHNLESNAIFGHRGKIRPRKSPQACLPCQG